MIIKLELSEDDLDAIVHVLTNAADYAGDMVGTGDDEDEDDAYRQEHADCLRLAGYLETVSYLAAAKEGAARKLGPSVN